IASANLNISNSRNTSVQFEVFNLTTNSTGWIERQNVTEYAQNSTGVINYTPQYIAASKSGVQNVTQNNYTTQSGTYTIVVPALVGCGYLDVPNTNYALAQNITSAGASCFSIVADNITLDCARYSITGDLTPNTYGVLINVSNNSIIKNCVIKKFALGINVTSSFNTTVSYNNVSYNTKGIRVVQSYNGTISDNVKIHGMTNRGLELFDNTDYFTVRNNSVESWTSEGIFVGGTTAPYYSEYNTIYNNTVSLNGTTLGQGGLDAGYRAIYNNFSSNIVNATNNGYGIVNENANTFDSNIIVTGNGLGIINGWTSAGWSNYSNNQLTSGNTSLVITNNVGNCRFYNNVFTSTASNATELRGSATTLNDFFRNTFTGNAYGIYFNNAPANKFVDSVISGVTGDLFLNGSSYDNLFINTTFTKSKATVASADSNFTVQWYLGVRVIDDLSAAVSGAVVNATAVNGTVLFSLTSDASGYAATQNVSEYFQTSGGVTNFTPHLLSASKNPSNTSTIQLTESKNAVVVLTYTLTISNVHVIDVTQNTVTTGWDTSKAANETIEYGLTTSYGSTYSNTAYAATHSAFITSLTAATTYHYRIMACDAAGACVYSSDYNFTTAGGSGGGTGGGSSGGGYIPTSTPTIAPSAVPSATEAPTVQPSLIGGDKDAHGCLIAAGYSWCEAKQKCLRTWEEPCVLASTSPSPTASATPALAPVSGSISSWLILLLVLILLLLAFFLYKRRKKKRGL
ncbi:right-handed parallel beta-helix repeat-containing protein, partial [Candidatus Micrarchaeota archaeon]|nr:right-handed parallel beta-helix repeat-containing protein [Candidatus Micrarchaeota archaeon]